MPTAGARATREQAWLGPVLAAITVTVYARTAGHEFINYDDPVYVTANPLVRDGFSWPGVVWAFTGIHHATWHPLTSLSHMLDCTLFGLNAGPHHLVNVALHAGSTWLLFALLARMTRQPWPSALVAALFALHPVHVESVAWISERKDVLSTLLWFATTWTYVAWVEAPGAGRYTLLLVAFALGLMAKPMLVTLPFTLLLLDYWPLGRVPRARPAAAFALVREKVPLFGLALAASVVTFLVQRRGEAVADVSLFPLTTRVANALVSYVAYLGKAFWPSGLAVHYPLHLPIPAAAVAGAVVVLLAVTALVVGSARTRPYLLVGWLWYLGTLVPVIGFVRVGEQAMADRYTYVPLVGIFIMIAWGAAELVERLPATRTAIVATAALAVGACAALTVVQVGRWHDSVTLLTHTLAVTTDNEDAQFGLGLALVAEDRVEEAIPHFREAVRLYPEYTAATLALARALSRTGKAGEAIEAYQQALRLAPGDVTAHDELGAELAGEGRLDEAAEQLRTAVRLAPANAASHYNLGIVLAMAGRTGEAAAAYRAALRLRPDWPEVENALAWVLATEPPPLRDPADAVRLAERACAATGRRDPAYLDTLAVAYAAAGRVADAVTTGERALALARDAGRDDLATEIAGRVETFRAARPDGAARPAS